MNLTYRALIIVLVLTLVLAYCTSCGIKGPPQAPIIKSIPKNAGLKAKLVGSSVHVSWVPTLRYSDGSELQLRGVKIYRMDEDLGERLQRQAEEQALLLERASKIPGPGATGLEDPPVGELNLRAFKIAQLPVIDFRKHARIVADLRIEQLLDRADSGAVHWQEPVAISSAGLPDKRSVYAIVEEDIRGKRSLFSNFATVIPLETPPAPTQLGSTLTQEKLRLVWSYPTLSETQVKQLALVGFNIYKASSDIPAPRNPTNDKPIETAPPTEWQPYKIISHLQVAGASSRYAYLFWTAPEAVPAGIAQLLVPEDQIEKYAGKTVRVELSLAAPGGECKGRLVLDATGAGPTAGATPESAKVFSEGENPLIAVEEISLKQQAESYSVAITLPVDAKALLLKIEPRGSTGVSAPYIIESVRATVEGLSENLVGNGEFDSFPQVSYEEEIKKFSGEFQYRVSALYTVSGFPLESSASEAKTVEIADTFPPETPRNLKAIGSTDTIVITWNASDDTDLRGYHVFRKDGEEASWKRITEQPTQNTVYRDSAVETGVQYTYRVAAVDKSGNRSSFTKEVSAQLQPK